MKKFRLLSTLVLILAVTASTFAQKTLKNIISNGELRVGMTGEQPPFTMKAANGDWIGYEVDLANALASSMNVELKIVELPFAELLPNLEGGKIDMVMSGMTITPERNMRAYFAGPYTFSGKSILTMSATLSKISKADEANMPKYKIACMDGSTSMDFVKQYMPRAEIIAVENYELGVQMVLGHNADALVADYPVCVINAMEYGSYGLVTLDQPLTVEPIGMALPAKDPLFHNLIDNYLHSLDMSGNLQLLHQIWFADGSWMSDVK